VVARLVTIQVDGLNEATLAALAGVPRVVLFDEVASTMDETHRLAEQGAESGTVVIANRQSAGRGRFGRKWTAEAGHGLWITCLERHVETTGLDVLSLRIGLALAPALDACAGARVAIKWPNDLLVHRRKLAGILVEARWRESKVEWVAIGVGVNFLVPPGQQGAAGLAAGTRRADLIRAVVAAVRGACMVGGELTADEMVAFSARDAARDELLAEPAAGRARGITTSGALVVETHTGTEQFRRGSLVFASEVE
jgi:BirA family biotin operon repressor/biotin-[acetyl-CoA-carboxylase] ligase